MMWNVFIKAFWYTKDIKCFICVGKAKIPNLLLGLYEIWLDSRIGTALNINRNDNVNKAPFLNINFESAKNLIRNIYF